MHSSSLSATDVDCAMSGAETSVSLLVETTENVLNKLCRSPCKGATTLWCLTTAFSQASKPLRGKDMRSIALVSHIGHLLPGLGDFDNVPLETGDKGQHLLLFWLGHVPFLQGGAQVLCRHLPVTVTDPQSCVGS